MFALASLSVSAQSPDFAWAKHMGGSNRETAVSISLDASGNIYTTGYFEGTVDFDPGAGTYTMSSPGDESVFVSKLDPQGNFLWARQISPPVVATNSDAQASSHVLCSNGDICVTGYFSGVFDFDPGAGNSILYSASENIFVVKLDPLGNFVWAKQFGGISTDMSTGIAVDAGNAVYTTGFFIDTVDFDPGINSFTLAANPNGSPESFISKLDASGNFVWAKSLPTTTGSVGYDVHIAANGAIYSTGTFNGTCDFDPGAGTYTIASAGDQDIYVWKLDASGNFLWAKTMGGTTKEGGDAVITDPAGNVYVGGFFTGTVDFDPGAAANNITSAGLDDAFVLKLDAQGNFIWANAFGSSGTDVTSALALDANGELYSTGQFAGTVDFNSGPGTYTLTGNSISSSFISKVDAQGNFKWARQIEGGQSGGSSITLDAGFNVYSTGYFMSTADFDGNSGIFNLTALGNEDVYIHKMSCGNPPAINAVSSATVLCEGNTAMLTASGALTYTWNTGSTNPLAVSPTITTNYTVTGSDASGCRSSVTITQAVSACTGMGPASHSGISVQAYPNPNAGRITLAIQANNEGLYTIKLMNALGQILSTEYSRPSLTSLWMEHLPQGIYFLSVSQDNTRSEIIKIIKE